MTQTASGFVLGFLLATAYGAGFHFLLGGPARRVVQYVLAAWLGFTIGHFIGVIANITLLKLGVLHLFSASVGAWAMLIVSYWLATPKSQ